MIYEGDERATLHVLQYVFVLTSTCIKIEGDLMGDELEETDYVNLGLWCGEQILVFHLFLNDALQTLQKRVT